MKQSILLICFLTLIPTQVFAENAEDLDLWAEADEPYQNGTEGEISETPWWSSFNDDVLTSLVEEAVGANYDIEAAIARLEAAEQRVVQTRGPLLPTVSLDGSLTAQPAEAMTFQMGGLDLSSLSNMGGMGGDTGGQSTSEVIGNGSLMVTLTYQIDIWGRQVEALRANQRAADASAEDLDALAFTVAGRIGEAYFDVLMAYEQIRIINSQLETQSSMLELLELRYQQNNAQASDVLQQRQQVASVRANLPAAQSTLRVALQRLSVLLGRSSYSQLRTTIPETSSLPAPPAPPATGRPVDLLETRPDLRASAERLESRRHLHRSSKRSFYPTLGISGSAGGQLYISNETDTQSTWNVGVQVSVPIFRGLSDIAAAREARANVSEARVTLESGLLQASTDVQGAIEGEREAREQLEAHQAMLADAEEAFNMARRSYVGGVGNYLSVMTALASFQVAELTVLQSRRRVLSARLQLHQALGGSWTRGLAARHEGDRS